MLPFLPHFENPLVISQVSFFFACSYSTPLLTVYLGSHMGVLSTAPLSNPFLLKKSTVPFNTYLLHQHGEPVQCIPFSTSPFSVLDIAASLPPSHSIKINEDLSIDPSSVKPKLVKRYLTLILPVHSFLHYRYPHTQSYYLYT